MIPGAGVESGTTGPDPAPADEHAAVRLSGVRWLALGLPPLAAAAWGAFHESAHISMIAYAAPVALACVAAFRASSTGAAGVLLIASVLQLLLGCTRTITGMEINLLAIICLCMIAVRKQSSGGRLPMRAPGWFITIGLLIATPLSAAHPLIASALGLGVFLHTRSLAGRGDPRGAAFAALWFVCAIPVVAGLTDAGLALASHTRAGGWTSDLLVWWTGYATGTIGLDQAIFLAGWLAAMACAAGARMPDSKAR